MACPRTLHDLLPGARVKGASGAACGRYAPLDPPTRSQKIGSYPGKPSDPPHTLRSWIDAGKRVPSLLLQIGGANIAGADRALHPQSSSDSELFAACAAKRPLRALSERFF